MNQSSKGRIRWAVAALAVAACAALPATAAAAEESVFVQLEAGKPASGAIDLVRDSGGRVTGRLPIINGFGAELPAAAAERLAKADGVKAVTPDGAVEPQEVKASDLLNAYPFSTTATGWPASACGTAR